MRTFPLNPRRKINPQRWYYWADVLGVAVLQDFVQKYGGASPATVDLFLHDAKAAVDGLYSHPSILQWEMQVLWRTREADHRRHRSNPISPPATLHIPPPARIPSHSFNEDGE